MTSTKHVSGWQYIFYEQDLGTIFRCYSLSSPFKILSCGFFYQGKEVYFLREKPKERHLRYYT